MRERALSTNQDSARESPKKWLTLMPLGLSATGPRQPQPCNRQAILGESTSGIQCRKADAGSVDMMWCGFKPVSALLLEGNARVVRRHGNAVQTGECSPKVIVCLKHHGIRVERWLCGESDADPAHVFGPTPRPGTPPVHEPV